MRKQSFPASWVALLALWVFAVMSTSSVCWATEPTPEAKSNEEQVLRALLTTGSGDLESEHRREPKLCTIQSISCGQTIFGSLDITDCGTTSNIDFFQIHGNAAKPFVTATLTSTNFAPFLGLLDKTPTVVSYSSTSPTAQVQYKLTSQGAPWTLGVTGSSDTFEFGDYSLSLQCASSSPSLVLTQGRFLVSVDWRNQFNGTSGTAVPIQATDLSGFFYFDDPSNIELMVKILDFGDKIVVFYGQLTNLNFVMKVVDTHTGTTKTYGNGPNDCGDIDENTFQPSSSPLTEKASRQNPRWLVDARDATERGGFALGAGIPSDMILGDDYFENLKGRTTLGKCIPSDNTLCLLDKRFQIKLGWHNQFNGASGSGHASTKSNLTGSFSFDDPSNIELLIKTLDFGDRILVLYGSLSNLEYSLTVTDTISGKVKVYNNPAGTYCGGLDNNF